MSDRQISDYQRNKVQWLPPLSYSSQFAAFNQNECAVGHHALQLVA